MIYLLKSPRLLSLELKIFGDFRRLLQTAKLRTAILQKRADISKLF
jgi:hypothetical protein